MPAPGDQHRGGMANPFEEPVPRMSEYTAKEVATLQSRLEKQLGPEYISSRTGPSGQKVHYVAAEKCIALANEVFGFNGWSSCIRDVQVDFVDESTTTGKTSLGLSVIVRVTLRDGSYHEDIGYGHIENCKGKAAAFEKAKKEGTTDALKRTLRNFGNILGNCVYDKEYLSKVTKMKVAPTKWDPANLHRHADFAPAKKEPASDPESARAGDSSRTLSGDDVEDEFGNFDEADFGVAETGHPDEVALGGQGAGAARQAQPLPPPAAQPGRAVPPAGAGAGRPSFHPSGPPQPLPPSNMQSRPGAPNRPQPTGLGAPSLARPQPAAASKPQDTQPAALPTIAQELGEYRHDPAVGFCHARAAEQLQGGDSSVLAAAAFDPKLDSPSLRKTQGVDHSVSKPLQRPRAGLAPAASPTAARTGAPAGGGGSGGGSSYVNPHLDPNRRVGMPAAAASPQQNRGSYKPPSMLAKRGADGAADAAGRAALGDVTAAAANAPATPQGEAKKAKTEAAAPANGAAVK